MFSLGLLGTGEVTHLPPAMTARGRAVPRLTAHTALLWVPAAGVKGEARCLWRSEGHLSSEGKPHSFFILAIHSVTCLLSTYCVPSIHQDE